ncbi:MAG: 1-acyl-sn-glycerol-3-phosphate acyltransferase [Planctomycetota bacterium]
MTVILSRPYEFVDAHRSDWWPWLIQRLRLIDWHLRRRESVMDYELRHADRLSQSLAAGHGILLAPNHCRYADPIVLGWLARHVNTHLFAMASWHLFNKNAFERFALRRMGAFSILREANDRQSLETAINALADANRPLAIFPEGTTNRTNDALKPLLDGVTFIARAAARRRAKANGGKLVMHPVGIKYVCAGDARQWAHEQLSDLESALCFRRNRNRSAEDLMRRLARVAEAFLALKEIEYTGTSSAGPLPQRRDALISSLLDDCEARASVTADHDEGVRDRVRKIRAAVHKQYFDREPSERKIEEATEIAQQADLAQFLLSFPDEYMIPGQVTDTQVVETIQRIQEVVYGKARDTMPLKVIMDVDDAIVVPPEKAPRNPPGGRDPLLCQLDQRLRTMVGNLATEARPFVDES